MTLEHCPSFFNLQILKRSCTSVTFVLYYEQVFDSLQMALSFIKIRVFSRKNFVSFTKGPSKEFGYICRQT